MLKSKDMTLLTKVHIVKAMVYPVCVDVKVGPKRRLSTKDLLLLNCGIVEDSWEFLGLQEIQLKLNPTHGYGFSSSHVCMGELDYKETWVPKNGCIWTMVLEKTLDSPWTARRSNHSILKEINPEYSLEGLITKNGTPILWPPVSKK